MIIIMNIIAIISAVVQGLVILPNGTVVPPEGVAGRNGITGIPIGVHVNVLFLLS